MCQAIKDIRKDGVAEGILMAIKAMMANLNLTVEQAVSAAGVPENERDTYISKLQSPSA